jgi:hypothetical protein
MTISPGLRRGLRLAGTLVCGAAGALYLAQGLTARGVGFLLIALVGLALVAGLLEREGGRLRQVLQVGMLLALLAGFVLILTMRP